MRSADQVALILDLAARGHNSCEISRRTGIPRSTIVRWRQGRIPSRGRARHQGSCLRCSGYRFPVPRATEVAYAYLLGLYLGDGSISAHPRGVFHLRIYLDRAYPRIVEECAAAIAIVAPENRVTVGHRQSCNVDVPSAYWRHWPCLFPQHGPGRKHDRRIALEPWQRAVVDRYPWRFLRGLIHSDGCRHLNTIKHPKKTYRYPRYEFSNRSDDIRQLFCDSCDLVGVRWASTNRWNISVARRESVALMDRLVGPKR